MLEPTKTPPNADITRPASPWRFCIAPMMEWSNSHCRYLWRLMSSETRLYTEMVVTGAILHGDQQRFLSFNQEEHPLALQLGGSDPKSLGECSRIAEEWGYDEVNLNCGCPSDRVQKGKIGAVLMNEPQLVADCVQAMNEACSIPVTVKHRIGIDDNNHYDTLSEFIHCVSQQGCNTFIVHARNAWLKGLSPKENREIPPLEYEKVIRLKTDFPDLNIVINGGINIIDTSKTLLQSLDGVMVGREAYSNPYFIAEIDQQLFNLDKATLTRDVIAELYAQYCEIQIEKGSRLHHMTRHVLGLYSGRPGGKLFRRHLSEYAVKADATADTLRDALQYVMTAP